MQAFFGLLTQETINNFFVHNPIFTISIGISAVIATLVYLYSFSDVIKKELKRRRMKHQINNLKEHYILCGFGRVGQQVAKELSAEKESFVIIERDESKLKLAKEHHWPYSIGDVALDESLFEKSQIDTAKAVIISVGSDADAIFMAVSARALKKDIFIVARASSIEAADKLTKIGVNRVALPYQIGGYHMATMALRPTVVDFLDTLVDQERSELEMEEYSIKVSSYYIEKELKETPFVHDGLAVLVLRRKDGKAIINPGDTTKLHEGDRLVVMGSDEKLQLLTREFDKKQPDEPIEEEKKSKPKASMDIKPSPFVSEE